MRAQPTEYEYTPLPVGERLPFIIPLVRQGGEDAGQPGIKPQANFFDKTKTDANVEFDILLPAYNKRKLWANYGMYWPKEDAKKTTKLFELAKALDPENVRKGEEYDLDRLLGREGELIVVDYVKQNGEPGQKIMAVFGSKSAPAAEAETEEAVKPKKIKI